MSSYLGYPNWKTKREIIAKHSTIMGFWKIINLNTAENILLTYYPTSENIQVWKNSDSTVSIFRNQDANIWTMSKSGISDINSSTTTSVQVEYLEFDGGTKATEYCAVWNRYESQLPVDLPSGYKLNAPIPFSTNPTAKTVTIQFKQDHTSTSPFLKNWWLSCKGYKLPTYTPSLVFPETILKISEKQSQQDTITIDNVDYSNIYNPNNPQAMYLQGKLDIIRNRVIS